jgi:hypothetical protein
MKVGHSVLQGSDLEPLLFLLYINDVTGNVQRAKLILFAYDINLLITRKDEFEHQHKCYEGVRNMV